MNLTLSLDEAIVQKVPRMTNDRDATSNARVRGYLASVAGCDDTIRKEQANKLAATVECLARDMATQAWATNYFCDERPDGLPE